MNLTRVNKHLQFISSLPSSKVEYLLPEEWCIVLSPLDVTLFSELIFILSGDFFLFLVHWPRVTLLLIVPQSIIDNILVLVVVILK